MNPEDGKKVIEFLHQAEKLKTLLRHSWLSSKRRESVAEHTWRMALMAMLLEPHLEKKVDLLKTLKIILIHDLVEINYKDNPAFKKQPPGKAALERKSLIKLIKDLPTDTKKEILELWEEYETGKTLEAKFAKAMDKTEVLLQHNEADIKFQTKKEISFNMYHGDEQSSHDSGLRAFREFVKEDTLRSYKKYKVNKKLFMDYL